MEGGSAENAGAFFGEARRALFLRETTDFPEGSPEGRELCSSNPSPPRHCEEASADEASHSSRHCERSAAIHKIWYLK
jgi:hypothetical protein